MSDTDTFRSEVRSWLETNCPESQRQAMTPDQQVWGGSRRSFPSKDAELWFTRMRDQRWIVPGWPVEYGGAGLDEQHEQILEQELRRLRCRKPLYDLGIWMLGPALLEFGTEAQKRKHLSAIAAGNARWCQGYSEPGAGSDLASLQTKAEDKGGHFLVNGSKIWTTKADMADWIFCLVRTASDGVKQQGISFLLIDMASPGVSTSPIDLISGESEFCQTFFDNVEVPKENLVGEIHQGWAVAKALLKHERKLMSNVELDTPGPSFGIRDAALDYLGLNDAGELRDPQLRSRLARHEMNMRALGLTHARTQEERRMGVADSNVPLMMKYAGTEEQKRKEELLLALMGMQALGWEGDQFTPDEIQCTRGWLYSKILTIAGGTSEVQLNIIAKRVLGLPTS